jgi:hypothetical protein
VPFAPECDTMVQFIWTEECMPAIMPHSILGSWLLRTQLSSPLQKAAHLMWSEGDARCIAVKSSVPQGMIVCFDKEVGWCVGIVVILVVGRER